jgi:mercuric ion transport protein
MSATWRKIKGGIAGAVALVACPCHLPLTLPVLLALSGGTALGAWLSRNTSALYLASTGLFVAGLLLAIRWLRDPGEVRENDSSATNKMNIPRLFRMGNGGARVLLLTSRACRSCSQAERVRPGLQQDHEFSDHKLDIRAPSGRELARKLGVRGTPTSVINARVACRGVPESAKAVRALDEDK